MNDLTLVPQALTDAAFAPFGEVIQADGRRHFPINDGQVQRFHDLATVDVQSAGGRPGISLFVARPYALPLALRWMERHPLSSQAFQPLDERPFLVVVAPAGETPSAGNIRAFVSDGRQGVNYRRGVWHHPLIAFGVEQTFVVIDRIGEDANCDLHAFDDGARPWLQAPD
ncbi:ureidoglycolate lyase [Xylophilus sp. GOD-11R]|uniref:ureidoglycolate lyase n=1 Tax=Xylophilus sp. GOD-11R TaxID=3089814 RepID=UPI00298D3C85|nr:ureidoglycolate lyase [Xylophilus sp. GOD-11R]WPB56657.1 ureidoglycolate lyase [Xylophilus sp. GOD-11R]